MNRTEKRKFTKELKKRNLTDDEINYIITALETKTEDLEPNKFADGDKVKLNIEKIKNDPNYKTKVSEYKDFVEDNLDKVFTIKLDDRQNDDPNLVTFEEESRWLFWHGFLTKVEE